MPLARLTFRLLFGMFGVSARRRTRIRRRGFLLGALSFLLSSLVITMALRQVTRQRPASILGDIGKFLEGVGTVADEIVHLAEAVWRAFGSVWTFLTQIATILTDAWQWVVNGANWIAYQIQGFAEEAYKTAAHFLTETVPHAIEWVFREAWKVAKEAADDAYNLARTVIRDATHFLTGLIHTLVNSVKGALDGFIHWAEGAIALVRQWGHWIVNLLSHPENIAKWVADAIIEPVILWFLRSGATVIGWLFRRFAEDSTEFVHIVEDALSEVL